MNKLNETGAAGDREYRRQFYELPGVWEKTSFEEFGQRQRIEDTIGGIPPDARTLLDVGCGNGLFVNMLADGEPGRFDRVVGLDPSEEALSHVNAETVQGSITDLPFESASFDLVTCLEVLEHIPEPEFRAGLSELQRVSAKYILVTVPNNQDLRTCLVVCRQCGSRFNPHLHLRSFSRIGLGRLVEQFALVKTLEIGPPRKRHSYGGLAAALYVRLCRPAAPQWATCPECRHVHGEPGGGRAKGPGCRGFGSAVFRAARSVVNLFAPVRARTPWLLALYERTDGEA